MQILTSYAQTELAHGSDVQSLQTLATFDKDTQEFVMHTPSIDAMKWWPGDLGLFSNYSLVFARLVSNGEDYGVQPFFIQIRDELSHKPLAGVEVGDIGPKLGYSSKDNGFLRLTEVRVPKNALLGKYIHISKDGTVQKRGNPKVMYSGMLFIRTSIVGSAYFNLLRASLIGIRYSVLRKQFKNTEGEEIPVIKYQMQKQKLYQ